MPVLIQCDCGKSLRVAEEHAGKRVKCPGCGEGLQVPHSQSPGSADTAVPGNGMVRFSCSCGKQLQAKEEYAGRMTRCPDCGERVPIPETERRVRSGKPASGGVRTARADARATAGPQSDFEFDDERRSPRKKRKRGGGGILLWLLVGAFLVFFLCIVPPGGVAVWWFFFRNSAADLKYVHGNAKVIVSVRAADSWDNSTVQKLVSKMKDDGQDPIAEMEKNMGFTPDEVERLTYVVMSTDNDDLFWVVVAGLKPYDRDKLLQEFKDPKEVQHAGVTFTSATDKRGKKMGFHFVSDKIFVFGTDDGLRRCLSNLQDGNTSGPLDNTITRIRNEKHAVVVGIAKLDSKTQKGLTRGMPAQAKQVSEDAGDFENAEIILDLDADLSLDATLTYSSDSKAQNSQKAIDKGLGDVKQLVGAAALFMNDPKASEALGKASKILDTVKVEQVGPEVKITARADTNTLDSLIDSIPKGGRGPGPGMGRPKFPVKDRRIPRRRR